MNKLFQWIKANMTLLVNAGSLVGATAVTSILGFAYWWVAARRYPPEAVGVASASVSAMTLLGGFCILGLGTLLITEIPRQPGHAKSLISTSLIVVGAVGGFTGAIFAIVAPFASSSFKPLGASVADIMIFASGVSLTSVTIVLDQSLIGLLRGSLQLWRNTIFAVAKLVAVFAVSFLLSGGNGFTIYTTWTFGNVTSLVAVAIVVVVKKGLPGKDYLPRWQGLRKLGLAALQHHLLNMTLQAPTLLMPVLVTVFLSATMNAWFYVSWMIVSFVFLIPNTLTIVLHAMNSAQQSTLGYKARVTLTLGLVACVLANCLLQIAPKAVLGMFGSSYAAQATWILRILLLAAFPLIIKYHYIAICRIQDRIAQAMLGMLPGGLLEISAAALGAHLGGLAGLSAGWVAAIYIESTFMFRTVYNTVRTSKRGAQPAKSLYAEAIWLMDTAPIPIIRPGYLGVEDLWLMDTSPLPILSLPTREQSDNRKSLRGYGANLSSRQSLKPLKLQRYTPYVGEIRRTNSYVSEQFFGQLQDNSTTKVDDTI